MEAHTPRFTTERELRALTTEELLALIQADIRELDARIKQRRAKPAPPPEPEPEGPPLHRVSCCGYTMGTFLAGARVRCPFCSTWHTAQ